MSNEQAAPNPVVSEVEAAESTASREPAEAGDRRESGRRARARDRLMDRATRPYPQTDVLTQADRVGNLLLFIDDDLRETALAMERIESYLVSTLAMLEKDRLTREQVHDLATDTTVLEHVDMLNETLESLRRRMARLASNLK
jgi:hypothetical protein